MHVHARFYSIVYTGFKILSETYTKWIRLEDGLLSIWEKFRWCFSFLLIYQGFVWKYQMVYGKSQFWIEKYMDEELYGKSVGCIYDIVKI